MATATEDLEIFILTHNRAEMLRHSIKSCLAQTIKGLSIIVLDNASTDHTSEVVASYQNPNLHYFRAKDNEGALGNILRCQQLCKKKYVMIFHDDDQLHPQYIEHAYSQLQAIPKANVIVSNARSVPTTAIPDFQKKKNNNALELDKIHFSAALYVRNKIAFSSAIYRKESLRALDFCNLINIFGKWGDRPIMIEAVGNGTAILIADEYVYTGRHDAQDTHFKETQPPHTLWLHREKFFRNILGDRITRFPGLCFCIMNHRRLKSGYKRRIAKDVSFSQYLNDAFAMGAATKRTWFLRWIAPRPLQNLLNAFSNYYLRKSFKLRTLQKCSFTETKSG